MKDSNFNDPVWAMDFDDPYWSFVRDGRIHILEEDGTPKFIGKAPDSFSM